MNMTTMSLISPLAWRSCSSKKSSLPKVTSKRLKILENGLDAILRGISSLTQDDEPVCLLQQYEEQLSEFKAEFSDIRHNLFSFDLEDTGDLGDQFARMEDGLFNCSLQVKKLLRTHDSSSLSSSSAAKGVRLPKLKVTTFDGNILNWKTFWEQFSVSVHERSNIITNSEKLAYLRHALRGGNAKHVIEGLSRSGEHYDEAVICLQSRFNRPCLIHQAHVQKVLKDGSGKELR